MRDEYTYNHWLIRRTNKSPKSIAVKSSRLVLTFEELYAKCKQYSFALKKIGISEEDKVAIVLSNSVDYLLVINALWLIGAIPVPINVRLSEDEIFHQIKFSDCRLIISSHTELSLSDYGITFLEVKELTKEKLNTSDFTHVKFNIYRNALMMFTSGSTGKPKCVEITFQNLLSNYCSLNQSIEHNSGDVWLASLPFYHIGGFAIISRWLLSGCSIAIPESLKFDHLLEAIKNFNPSFISLVEFTLKKLLDNCTCSWNNLKVIFLGGGPISHELIRRALELNFPIATVYGSTETTSMVTMADTTNIKHYGLSAGKPMPDVKISLGNGNEIIVESPSVAKGYYKSELSDILANGKYVSNDIGRINEHGNLIVFGRKDDIIISGGENISLNEIELTLNEKHDFGRCVTIPIADEKWGQSYMLVTDSNGVEIRTKIEQFIIKKLGKYKLPKEIKVVKNIPITDLGKVQKEKLRELLRLNSY